ncbi:MAG: flippase [Calditrichaeota bacterium]|nr:flippase [Calditrichota bacterium]
MRSSIAKDSLMTFGTRLLMFLVQGINGLLLARLLGPTGRGQYALIVLVPTVAALIFNFGLSTSSAYFVSSGKIPFPKMFGTVLLWVSITGTAGILLTNGLAPVYLKFYPEVPLPLFRLGSAAILLILLFNNSLTLFQGRSDFKRFNLINGLNPFLFLMGFLLLVVVLKFKLTGAVFSYLIGLGGAALAGFFLLLKQAKPVVRAPVQHLKKIVRYSSRVAVAEIVTFLNYRFDMFLVGYFLGAKAVGLYAVAVLIAETLWYLSSSVGTVLLPAFGTMTSHERMAVLTRVLRHIFWISVAMIAILFLIDYPLVKGLFGAKFLPSVLALRGLYVGVIALSLAKIISSYILSLGKPAVTMRIALAGFALNLSLNVWWIPKIGILGAALASTAAYSLMLLLDVLWLWQNSRPRLSDLLVPKRDDFRFYGRLIQKGWMQIAGRTST